MIRRMTVTAQEKRSILDDVISSFGDRIGAIEFERRFTEDAFRREYSAVVQRVGNLPMEGDRDKELNFRLAWSMIVVKDVLASPGKQVCLGLKEARDEEWVRVLRDAFNQQNLWFMVSAYEEFEGFIKDIYAALGYLDPSLWRCEDFGAIRLGDIESKDLEWFLRRVRDGIGRHSPKDILKRFRDLFPTFVDAESKNETSLKVWVGLAQCLRHGIVHSGGRVKRSKFMESLEKATGESFRGRPRSVYDRRRIVDEYLLGDDEVCTLQAIRSYGWEPPYHNLSSPLQEMIRNICTHACLLYNVAIMHVGEEPYWTRKKGEA